MLSILFLAAILQFSSPVHVPIELAGNFGEPRPNHFHGGIDVKTERREGLGIYAIGGGYVSKIIVNRQGMGRALYINHPEGYTSVHYHLRSFAPAINNIVTRHLGKELTRRQQPLADEECTIDLKPGQLMVSRGMLIARSGNSGASQAAHLHLEIHNTRTGEMLDPADFLTNELKDNTPPMAHSLMVYPQKGQGTFLGTDSKQSFGFGGYDLRRDFWAWGKIGFGIWANDFSEVTYNRLGVRHTWLICDGDTVCHTDVGSIPLYMNREINAWGDYDHFLRTRNWYVKAFRPSGVSLPIIHTENERFPRGIVEINEERDYHFAYVLADQKGNKAEYRFTVRGRKTTNRKVAMPDLLHLVRTDRTFRWNSPDIQLTIPARNSGEDFEISPRRLSTTPPNALSPAFTFSAKATPLFRFATIRIRLNRKPSADKKLILSCDYGTWKDIPLEYKDGWATGRIRELGALYYVKEM